MIGQCIKIVDLDTWVYCGVCFQHTQASSQLCSLCMLAQASIGSCEYFQPVPDNVCTCCTSIGSCEYTINHCSLTPAAVMAREIRYMQYEQAVHTRTHIPIQGLLVRSVNVVYHSK